MGIPICGACRRPIEERVVTALGMIFEKINIFCTEKNVLSTFRVTISDFKIILGKHWHVEHFVCAKCEKPFLGNRHYERKGLAYCETHYHQLFGKFIYFHILGNFGLYLPYFIIFLIIFLGNLCYVCNQVIQGDVFTALNKAW